MLRIALDRYDVNRFRLMRMNVDRKSEIAWQIAADLIPRTARVIAAHYIPMLLHEQRVWARRMHRDPMHTVTDLRVGIRDVLRVQPAIDWHPCLSAIVGAKRAGSRDCDGNSLGIIRIEKNGVQTHSACAGLPLRTGIVAPESCQFMPRFSAVF